MASISSGVWDRRGADDVSRRYFNLLYGVLTMFGLGVTATGAFLARDVVLAGAMAWVVPIGVLVVAIIGVIMAMKSNKPIISFTGYMLVAGPFGLLLGPLVAMYSTTDVTKAVFVTALVAGVMTLIGIAVPDNLKSWGLWLLGGLMVLIVGLVAIPVLGWLIPGFPITGALTLWDWIGVALFSAYVIYDVNRSKFVAATVDNAIDCALALYLDIINLFIRFLSILSGRR